MKGNIGKGDGERKSVAHVSFIGIPWCAPLYWSKSTGVCVPPVRTRGLRGLSRFIIILSSKGFPTKMGSPV